MKCEICHKAEAETVIWKETEEGRQELYVCALCAKKQSKKTKSSNRKTMPRVVIAAPSMEDLKELPPQILEAFQKIMGDALSVEPDVDRNGVCPKCGISLGEILSRGRVGCAACYTAFPLEEFEGLEKNGKINVHCGKTPWPKKNGEGA